MPTAREHTALRPVLLQYLATGDHTDHGAPPGGRLGTGAWEAFDLDGKFHQLRYSASAELGELYDRLLAIWQEHHAAIEAAAPAGYAPYLWSMLVEAWRILEPSETPDADEDEQHAR